MRTPPYGRRSRWETLTLAGFRKLALRIEALNSLKETG